MSFLEHCNRRYGSAFTIRYPYFGRIVYFADPEVVGKIFKGDSKLFHAGEANAGPLEPVLGAYSLLTLDEDEHMRQRKLLLPPFHGEAVRRYGELMAEVAEREVERWPIGTPFPLRPRMQAITLEVILRAVFGVRGEERRREFRELLPRLGETNLVIWFPALRRDLGPWSPWAKFKRRRRAVDELLYDEIRRRRSDPDLAQRDDVLSLLLQARHDDGSPMSDRELRDELMTLLTAGHETTATALAWAFERLLRNPAALDRLLSDLDDGDYLDAVVKETLRVRPILTDVARRLTAPTEIGGYRLPEGTLVMPAIALVQLLPEVYPDPHAFRPERFLEGQPEPYTWIPFGGGIRRCLGAAFATFEIKVVLRTILARAKLRALNHEHERARVRNVTVVPDKGTAVVLEQRLPATAGQPGERAEPAPAAPL